MFKYLTIVCLLVGCSEAWTGDTALEVDESTDITECRETVAPAVCSLALECGDSDDYERCLSWVAGVCIGRARAIEVDWSVCAEELGSLECGGRWFYDTSCFGN